jgi:hypothetical protein
VIFVGIKKRLESEETVLTADGGGAAKLKSCPVKVEKTKGTAVHDGGKNLTAYVHQHDASPFVWIRQIAGFWYRDTLADMPPIVVGVTFKEG